MPIITISRGAKSGGEELAKRLAKQLNYQAMNQEIIAECGRKYNIMEDDLLEKLEETPGLWHRLTRDYNRQLIYIKCALLDAAKKDNIIYYGHAGQLFLAGISNVLKLRIEAPLDKRISAAMQESQKDHQEAVDYLKDLDDHRRRWVKLLYHEDWQDPSLYDLIINLQNMSFDTICDLVTHTIKSKDFQTTESSLQQINDISLACEVKAAIAADDKIYDQAITVSARNDVIILRGNAKNKKLRDILIETASQVKGVKGCENHITLTSDPIQKGRYENW